MRDLSPGSRIQDSAVLLCVCRPGSSRFDRGLSRIQTRRSGRALTTFCSMYQRHSSDRRWKIVLQPESFLVSLLLFVRVARKSEDTCAVQKCVEVVRAADASAERFSRSPFRRPALGPVLNDSPFSLTTIWTSANRFCSPALSIESSSGRGFSSHHFRA